VRETAHDATEALENGAHIATPAYGAIILSLPIVLYQAYAYLLPAFSDHQRHTIMPLPLLIPVLFIAGIAFGYVVVLPAATKFLLKLQRLAVQHPGAGEGVLQLLRQHSARLRCRLPGPGRDPRGDPPGHRQGAPAAAEPSLCLPRLRGHRRGATPLSEATSTSTP